MIRKDIKEKILAHVVRLDKFGINDLTWDKESAKKLISSLMIDDIGILGGSVYKIESNKLIPMYDNWSCSPEEKELRKEFYHRSKIKAIEYIEKYPVYPNEEILFSIVFTERID